MQTVSRPKRRFLAIFTVISLLTLTLTMSTAFAQALTPEQIANQRLGKAMDVIASQDALLAAKKEEIAAKDDQVRLQKELIDALKIQVSVLTQQNADISKLKCDKTSILWVISIKRCR